MTSAGPEVGHSPVFGAQLSCEDVLYVSQTPESQDRTQPGLQFVLCPLNEPSLVFILSELPLKKTCFIEACFLKMARSLRIICVLG